MVVFWAVMRTEICLVLRRRSFWVMQGLVLLAALKVLPGLSTPLRIVWHYVINEVNDLLMMELILLPLIVGPVINRDLGEIGEWLWATPLGALCHSAGVTGGIWFILMAASVIQLGARWLIGYVVYSLPTPLLWVYGLPLVTISVSVGLGLVVLLALLLRRTVPLLLTWGVVVASMLARAKMPLPLNIGFSRLQLSPALGLGAYRPLVYGLGLWLVGVALMALPFAIGVALLLDRRRGLRRGAPLLAWVLVAGLVMGGGRAWHARAAAEQSISPFPMDVPMPVLIVRAHTLQATVDVAQHTIQASSTLVLEPVEGGRVDKILLRLDPGFALRKASNETGEELVVTREERNVVVSLPEPVTAPFTLHLAWRGRPRLAYADYTGSWSGEKRPVRALLADGGGYLLRDGDWYPWPWTAGPHQAERSHVTLEVKGGRALASAPLRDGQVEWIGPLPSALLAVPPSDEYDLAGTTLYVGRWPVLLGPSLLERLKSFEPAAFKLSQSLGDVKPPVHLVACPYLSDFVWSGALLLVPEGTGFLDWDRVMPAYWYNPSPGIEERAIMTVLARAWLSEHVSAPRPSGVTRTRFAPDVRTEILALWIALELAEPDVRAADLELLQDLASPASPILYSLGGGRFRTSSEMSPEEAMAQVEALSRRLRDRVLRFGPVIPRDDSALLLALHEWATAVGPERALRLLGETVRAGSLFDLEHLLDDLELGSGVFIERPPNFERASDADQNP
jgi:hypothetical protein